MSMVNDIMGLGRSAYVESTDTLEPEIADMRLEDAEELEEGTDLMDFMNQVAFECDMNMKDLEMAVIADEYNYLRENGEEMIYEDSRMQSFINKFKEITKKIWAQIQKFYKAAMKKVDEFLHNDKKFIDKYKKKANGPGAYRGVPKSELDEAMSTVIYSIDAMTTHSTGIGQEMFQNAKHFEMKDYNDKSDGFSDKAVKNFKKHDYSTKSSDSENYSKMVSKAKKSIFKGAFEKYKFKDGSVNNVYAGLIKTLKQRSGIVKMNGELACKELKDLGKYRARFKKTYDASKKLINAHLKNAKKAESLAKRFRVVPTKLSTTIHTVVKVLNLISKWCTQASRCGFTILNMERNMLKAAIVSSAAGGGKKKMEKTEDKYTAQHDKLVGNTESFLDAFDPNTGMA